MKEIELYHIHKKNNFDRKWQINNMIKVNENFNSIMNQRQMNFSQIIALKENDTLSKTNYTLYLTNFYSRIKDLNSVRASDLEELKKLLEIGYQMSYNADFFKRESALENCRKDYNDKLPSRLHSIYLCDKDGLEYWTDTISKQKKDEVQIFKVLVEGNTFKTNEQLIPNEISTYEETYNNAFKYWKPKFKSVPNYTNEYLAQGNIKILTKIK